MYASRDIICDVNHCAWAAELRYESNKLNDVSDPSGISLPVNSTPGGKACKIYFISLVMFSITIYRINCQYVPASNKVLDEVTYRATQIVGIINFYCSSAGSTLKFDEKNLASLINLMVIR